MPLLLAALALAQPTATLDPAPPPEAMVDFLGRRRLCLELPAPDQRNAYEQSESRRLACTGLAAEERVWRDRYRGSADALAWLDRDPRDFRMPGIMVRSGDGPPGAYVHRMEWTGTENGGPAPFRLGIDSDAEQGATTLITASYGDVPERSFRVDNARFPWLDLQSVRASLGTDLLRIDLRFGYRRGYCGELDEDDRPILTIRFARDRASATFEDRTNCAIRNVELPG
jgi:hypothetical protein